MNIQHSIMLKAKIMEDGFVVKMKTKISLTIYAKRYQVKKEGRVLRQLCDFLLPMLTNGQVQVKEEGL